MLNLLNTRNVIIAKNSRDVIEAKNEPLSRFIVLEDSNIIFVWHKERASWVREKYVMCDEDRDKDFDTSGFKAYREFYKYCGKEEVERMKNILSPIPMWESFEQLHYFNIDYSCQKINKNIYEFDANSSFTYGALQLPNGFDILKEYMYMLYEKKSNAVNKLDRSRYKNMQNYLIGYFAKIKQFIRVRSDIICKSNFNINIKMAEIQKNKGVVFLSNTDSIVTDDYGAEVMQKYIGTDVGQFKLSAKTDRLYYESSNAYQIGQKVVWSGLKYFARKETDIFNDRRAKQYGNLIEGFDYIKSQETGFSLCKVRAGEIRVEITNLIGEHIGTKTFKIK